MTVLPGVAEGKLKDLSRLKEGPLGRALEALNGGGEETRLVGGAVRDLALGASAFDLDLATTAAPSEVMRRATAAAIKLAPTGLAHGTVTIVIDGQPIEITTLREDLETDGRHAKVAFGRDFFADARRRDFTINALSLAADGRVYDYVGGLDDLAARRVRFIGDPAARIREDYLRILRFFRFSARFASGDLDAEGLSASIREREGMAQLSHERVRSELIKLLSAPHAGEVVRTMGHCGFLEPILGGLAYPTRLTRLIAIETARGPEPDAVLRLAALGAAIPENAERLQARLRLANGEQSRIAAAAGALIGLHGIVEAPPPDDLRRLLFTARRGAARDALALAQAESGVSPDNPDFESADRFLADSPEPELPFSGADLIARGVPRGRAVGEALRSFQALWVGAGFPAESETLERLLDEALAQQSDSI
jgi:poly(A) polymerase